MQDRNLIRLPGVGWSWGLECRKPYTLSLKLYRCLLILRFLGLGLRILGFFRRTGDISLEAGSLALPFPQGKSPNSEDCETPNPKL